VRDETEQVKIWRVIRSGTEIGTMAFPAGWTDDQVQRQVQEHFGKSTLAIV
jgi:hypothetical protein